MSTISALEQLELLTIDDLAKITRKTPAALYSLYTRNPAALPVRVALPGVRRVYFRKKDVESWIERHIQGNTEHIPCAISGEHASPRRGRPTKAEQLRRAAASTASNKGSKQ